MGNSVHIGKSATINNISIKPISSVHNFTNLRSTYLIDINKTFVYAKEYLLNTLYTDKRYQYVY